MLPESSRRWLPRRSDAITVRAWLGSPIVWDHYDGVTLDGALQYAVVALESGVMPDDLFAGYTGAHIEIPIPVRDVTLAGSDIALCSWAHLPGCSTDDVRVRRRRLRVDSMGGTAKVRANQGPFKATQLPTPTMCVPYVEFYVDGDRELLRGLLVEVAAIGRARGGGLGHVIGYELIPRSGDVLVRNGKLTRTVPAGSVRGVDANSYSTREATTRAPYWKRDSRQLCWVPVLEAA